MGLFTKKNKPHLVLREKCKGKAEYCFYQNEFTSDKDFIEICDKAMTSNKAIYEWRYIFDTKSNQIVREYL